SGSGKWGGLPDLPDRPGEVKLWDVDGRKELASFDGHSGVVFSVAFSPDGKTLASGCHDEAIKLWDVSRDEKGAVASRKERAPLRLPDVAAPKPGTVRAAAYLPEAGALAFALEDGPVQLLDAATGEVRQVLQGHADAVLCLAAAPDGLTLASGSAD